MEFDKLAMVEVEDSLFSSDNIANYEFCRERALLKTNTWADQIGYEGFLFNVTAEEDQFNIFLKKAFDAKCTKEFLDYFRKAKAEGANQIMFYRI